MMTFVRASYPVPCGAFEPSPARLGSKCIWRWA